MINKELLINFLKEEIRLHTTLYKARNFYTYPINLFLFFFLITLGGGFLYDNINIDLIGVSILHIFFIGGVMSGAFGLYAKDFLERRFADYGRLFSNTLILPIKLKTTFITLSISDSIFYLFWFIFPTIFGISLGIYFIEGTINFLIKLLFSSFLSFIMGLFFMFFLSVLYERNKKIFLLTIILLSSIFIQIFVNYSITEILIYNFYLNNNYFSLFLSIILIFILMILSYISIGKNSNFNIRYKKNLNSMSFPKKINFHIFKDYIDLKRTGGLIGKPLFLILIPSILLMLLFSTMDFLRQLNLDLVLFAILFGSLSTQLFNSLISSDDFRYYRYLPVSLKTYIISKIKLTFIISFILGLILILGYSTYISNFSLVIKSLIVLTVLIIYNLSLSFNLTGLNPNENLLQSKIFIKYFVLFLPILFASMLLELLFLNIFYQILYVFIFLSLAKIYLTLGFKKWNHRI